MKSLIPYVFCVILGAVLVLWFRGCKDAPCSGTDGKVISTTVKSDSATKILPADTSAWHKPKPTTDSFDTIDSLQSLEGGDIGKAIKTGQYRDQPKSLVHTKPTPAQLSDTPQVQDIPGIVDDYLEPFDYAEDYHFNNGDVHVETHISANKIDSQRVILSNVKEKIITNTVTVTKEVQAAKHNEVWIGLDAMGNMTYPLFGFGPNLSFVTKSGKEIDAGVYYLRSDVLKLPTPIMIHAGIKTKITFRKQ